MSNNKIATCKFCDPPDTIEIIKNPDSSGKWHPLNLDGRPHVHNKPFIKRETQSATMQKYYPNTAPPRQTSSTEDNDEAYEDKLQQPSSTMQVMHDENIAKWDAIAKSNEKVATATDKQTKAIELLTAAIAKLAQQNDSAIGGYVDFRKRKWDNPENDP